ncbi:MAG: endonuclease/exonuclease/phosphatase family protein [Pseudomonadota bacterium]
MHGRTSLFTVTALGLFTTSCAIVPVSRPAPDPRVATTVETCRASIRQPDGAVESGLGERIELLNWNIKKGSRDVWQDDLRSIALDADLVVLQEAAANIGIEDAMPHLEHSSFARGFTTGNSMTGVATYSHTAPISECQFRTTEPWLRTPKATSVTRYPLSDSEQTLLVVNLHAVNFTVGVARYREQILQVRDVVEAHRGPIILSGDFNTWNRKRVKVVDTLVNELGLTTVSLHTDNRKTFNRYPLDHVFVRGFTEAEGGTVSVHSSDHNPMLIELLR